MRNSSSSDTSSVVYYSAEESCHESEPDSTIKDCAEQSANTSIEDSLIQQLKKVTFADDLHSPMMKPTVTSTPITRSGILKTKTSHRPTNRETVSEETDDLFIRRPKNLQFTIAEQLRPNMNSPSIVRRGILKHSITASEETTPTEIDNSFIRHSKQVRFAVADPLLFLHPKITSTPIVKPGILKNPISKKQESYQCDYVMMNETSEVLQKLTPDEAEKMYRERYACYYEPPTKRIGLRL